MLLQCLRFVYLYYYLVIFEILFLCAVAPTPIITTRNEDSVSSAKYTFTNQSSNQSNPSLVLKKKDSTVQCSQTTTTIKSTIIINYFTTKSAATVGWP